MWNVVRWASGSSIPVKETFGPRDVVGRAAFTIARENGIGRALSGTGGTRENRNTNKPYQTNNFCSCRSTCPVG